MLFKWLTNMAFIVATFLIFTTITIELYLYDLVSVEGWLTVAGLLTIALSDLYLGKSRR